MKVLPMTKPTTEQISVLRWLAIFACAALFVSDYGLDVWAKPVPVYTYYMLGAIAIGIDVPQLRGLFLTFLKGMTGGKDK